MTENIFEQIKKINEYKQEYWNARDLMAPLGYVEWRKFESAIKRAKEACKNSGQLVRDHFGGAAKMIKIATGTLKETLREINDYHLSRYACYLIAQNGDPRKKEIALAQTYFAIQTRRQEMQELLEEDNKRIFLREDIKDKNRKLFGIAKSVGIFDYANFQDAGYMGLYGGLRQKDIKANKKLEEKESILDYMGSEELAANIFRATQTSAKIKRENITGQQSASFTHHEVGKKIRETITELGGTMPEKLPTPKHIKESKKRIKTSLRINPSHF
ncbi:DNA damage-inducible protein D [Candidatus Kuenenbacteria bacterium]|nr:DNA damage-inducible protein D [Candidatus Kuenenbacteria bacterium]